jgi:hypothetical protein
VNALDRVTYHQLFFDEFERLRKAELEHAAGGAPPAEIALDAALDAVENFVAAKADRRRGDMAQTEQRRQLADLYRPLVAAVAASRDVPPILVATGSKTPAASAARREAAWVLVKVLKRSYREAALVLGVDVAGVNRSVRKMDAAVAADPSVAVRLRSVIPPADLPKKPHAAVGASA